MPSSESTLKRSSSSLSGLQDVPESKRQKRPYHHHHCLQKPINTSLHEPAITDDVSIDDLMNRAIATSFKNTGFDQANPVALDSVRQAAEEYIMKLASYVRQSMLSSRRIQPIPQDFEHALKRQRLRIDDLRPYLTRSPNAELSPSLAGRESPPPKEDLLRSLPFLGPQLSGEVDRAQCRHIPNHLPQFPSRHTYRYTPVFTEREQDPRKIRERATEDGRHGEDALRKLARAAFQDNQLTSTGQDKKLWGRKTETMDSMFEKTVKSLVKKMQLPSAPVPGSAMEIDSGHVDPQVKRSKTKVPLGIELPPIINCERDFWRRSGATGNRSSEQKSEQKATEQKSAEQNDTGNIPRADNLVSAV